MDGSIPGRVWVDLHSQPHDGGGEFIPDNLPPVGNLDEGGSSHFGVDGNCRISRRWQEEFMMDISNAWYLRGNDSDIVIELADLSSWTILIAPQRTISINDLTKYTGKPEPSAFGTEVSDSDLAAYGLKKFHAVKNKSGIVRLSPEEKRRLQLLARHQGLNQSDLIRQHILPTLRNNTIFQLEEK